MKTCIKCLKFKPESEFYRHKKSSDGLASACKSCDSKRKGEWARENPGSVKVQHIKSRYGLTEEEYNSLSDNCEICGSCKNLGVDHDHNFGFVRGILCTNCNVGLGMFLHDPELLQRASVYLSS